MSNVRTSKKWLSVVDRNDGTAEKIIMAIVQQKEKLSSKEGVRVSANGCTYVVRNSRSRYSKD